LGAVALYCPTNKMKKSIFLIILIFNFSFLIFNCLHSAEDDPDDTSQWESDSDIEDAYQDGEIDDETYERLLTIYDDKIDINNADVLQLQSLPGLSPLDASKIVSYRLKHGYYKDIKDLINPEIIDEVTFDNIKIFITAETPEKIKTKGDILFKTKSNQSVELNTTEYPRTYDLFRLRLLKFGRYLKFGAIIEGDARLTNYYYNSGHITGGEFEHGYRLNKSYVGYEKGPVIEQAYLGNFRAGFGQRLVFDNSGKSSPAGLYPDDTYSRETQVTMYSRSGGGTVVKDKYTLGSSPTQLKGFGARIIQGRFDLTEFYSKSGYSYKTYVRMADEGTRLVWLEDIVEETLNGCNLTYKLTDATPDIAATYIGTTLYASKREQNYSESDIWIWRYPPQQSFAVYGTNFATGYRGFNITGELAKVHGWGDAWYIKTFKKMGKIDVIYSHRDYALDFYNPWARGYSKHRGARYFKNRDEQGDYIDFTYKMSRTMKLKFNVDQFKHTAMVSDYGAVSYETPTVDRDIYLKYNWKLPRGVNIQLDRKWKDYDIYKNEKSSEKMMVTTNFQLKFKPSKVSDLLMRYKYKEDYADNPTKYIPKDEVTTRATYDITGNLEIAGELKFADTDLRKSAKESRQYYLQVTDKLSRYARIKIKFTNKYKWSADEFIVDEEALPVEPGYVNKWEVRVDYKW